MEVGRCKLLCKSRFSDCILAKSSKNMITKFHTLGRIFLFCIFLKVPLTQRTFGLHYRDSNRRCIIPSGLNSRFTETSC